MAAPTLSPFEPAAPPFAMRDIRPGDPVAVPATIQAIYTWQGTVRATVETDGGPDRHTLSLPVDRLLLLPNARETSAQQREPGKPQPDPQTNAADTANASRDSDVVVALRLLEEGLAHRITTGPEPNRIKLKLLRALNEIADARGELERDAGAAQSVNACGSHPA